MKRYVSFDMNKTQLTKECVEKCCRKAIEDTEVEFFVKTSARSDSQYVYLKRDETFYVVRISDHMTEHKHFDKQIILGSATKNKTVIAAIRNGIRILRAKRISYVIKQLQSA